MILDVDKMMRKQRSGIKHFRKKVANARFPFIVLFRKNDFEILHLKENVKNKNTRHLKENQESKVIEQQFFFLFLAI